MLTEKFITIISKTDLEAHPQSLNKHEKGICDLSEEKQEIIRTWKRQLFSRIQISIKGRIPNISNLR